jgi:hypothetical protein
LTHGSLEIDEALGIAIAIAGALDKAHRQGVFTSPTAKAAAS